MSWSVSKKQKTGAFFIMVGSIHKICLSWVTAVDEDDKTLNLKIGFDLTQEKNGAPSLRIHNFEVPEFGGGRFKEEKRKRSLRAETSSENDEVGHEKVAPEGMESKERNGSEDDDTSGSEGDRRLSTKGIAPDEFEPERSPSFDRRNNKNSDTE